jgi:hypothetical protein
MIGRLICRHKQSLGRLGKLCALCGDAGERVVFVFEIRAAGARRLQNIIVAVRGWSRWAARVIKSGTPNLSRRMGNQD